MPFGTDVGIIAFMMLFIFTIYMSETNGRNPVFRLLSAGMSVYMFTQVTSPLGMLVFFGFGAYNLFSIIR